MFQRVCDLYLLQGREIIFFQLQGMIGKGNTSLRENTWLQGVHKRPLKQELDWVPMNLTKNPQNPHKVACDC